MKSIRTIILIILALTIISTLVCGYFYTKDNPIGIYKTITKTSSFCANDYETMMYPIKYDDTLVSIAKKYKTDTCTTSDYIDAMRKINNIGNIVVNHDFYIVVYIPKDEVEIHNARPTKSILSELVQIKM